MVNPNFQIKSQPVTYSDIMKQRYISTKLQEIPVIDKEDLITESPLFNPNFSAAAVSEGGVHQATPEFAQSSYLRLRSQEEAYMIWNYLDPKC
jgi:hypothetical protein